MLTVWKPFNQMTRWHQDLDNWFNWNTENEAPLHFKPSVDVRETENEFLLQADLPGIDKKDIEVKVEDGILYMSGKRESTQNEQKDGYRYRERQYGSFERRFSLGDHIAIENIKASHENGVLTLTLPKREEAKPKQIEVTVN